MRVVVIWLDAFDGVVAERLRLPTLSRLRSTSAHATVDGRFTQRGGSTPLQLMAGVRSDAGGPGSPIAFDPATYRVRRRGRVVPWFRDIPTTVLDTPFVELGAGAVRGVVDWGTHDHSGPPTANPDPLLAEIGARFGDYRAQPWRFATPWASAQQCTDMGNALAEGVGQRLDLARWLLADRLPDWELAVVSVSEAHSAAEGLYHGVDDAHPLAHAASADAAGDAFERVYLAIDEFVDGVLSAVPDAVGVVFSPHGMSTNVDDVPSMLLLSELLATWHGAATPNVAFPTDADGLPTLSSDEDWNSAIGMTFSGRSPHLVAPPSRLGTLALRGRSAVDQRRWRRRRGDTDWIPSIRRQPLWSSMRAFALPTVTIAKVRVNVAGREGRGVVEPADYGNVLDDVEALLRACVDPVTGRPVVAATHRPFANPFDAGDDDADLEVDWAGMPLGFEHPQLGTIGPFPARRTGGHTNPAGTCLIHHPTIAPTNLGAATEFDITPTVLDLLGANAPWPVSGRPLPLQHVADVAGGGS